MATATLPSQGLERYVPRLASEWELESEGRPWREIDSTLCFVDISGFTKLSERLARRGRIGAEELTEVLNRVFGEMLDMAYARGGSLIKFGGDALLLHFAGDHHAVHGACAAVEMRAALRHASQHKTSVGRVPLRMSVGVHSGVVHLFRVGTSHHELVISGPAASRVALMESVADAGEILVSPETAAQLPVSALGACKDPGVLLRWRRGAFPGPGLLPRRPVPVETIAECLPVALRGFLAQDVIEPEHRLATVGFVKFQGVDRLMESDGPPAVAEALHELISIVQAAADKEGVTFLGTDVDKDGGKVILVTGVPNTKDDDDGRMMRAAREIVEHDARLSVRIGVNRGHVFAGEVGAAFRATFTVMGDTVNLAARLMAAAPAGAVYASPQVLDRSRTLFETEALEPFYVKGKSLPVQAYSVGRRIGRRTTSANHELPFIGRDAELAVLVEALDAASNGTGSVVTVVGNSGVGKTRLLHEARARVAVVPVLEFSAEQAGSTSPYRGFRDPIRALLEIPRADQATMAARLRDAVEEVAPALVQWLPLLGDVTHIDTPATPAVDSLELRFRPDKTADAVVQLLDACLSGPLIVVFEDAQWMDSASAALVERMSMAVRKRPWLFVIARRSGPGGPDPSGQLIELQPLAAADAKAIVIAATAAAPLRPHEIDLIVERAGGSPLFLGEVLRMARSGQVDDLPDSLDATVNAEIDALDVLPRRIVRYASVLGRSFRTSVLRELMADAAIELDDATTRQLGRFLEFDGSERVRFRQEMHREVAYEGLPYRRRRELHLQAGQITERMAGAEPDTVADLLARHYALAHEHRLARHYAQIAGDRARLRYANLEAAIQYQRALDAARRLDDSDKLELIDLWRMLGDVREQLGEYDEGIDAYRRAAALAAGDEVARADLLLRRARARMHLGAYRQALAEATKGCRLLADRTDPAAASVRARLIALQALLRQAQQRAVPARALAERAIEEARNSDDDTALARAYLVSAWAYRILGIADADARGELALELYERVGDLDGAGKASNNLGGIAYYEGRWDDAERWYRRALDAYYRCGDEAMVAVTGSNLSELLVSRGVFDEAETMLHESIRVLRGLRALDDVLFAEIQLGRLLVERGDAEAAVEYLVTVRAEAAGVGQVGYAFEAALYLASGLAALDRHDEAIATLDAAIGGIGQVDPVYRSTLARVRAAALAGLGRYDEAQSMLAIGLVSACEQGLEYEEALLLRDTIRLARVVGYAPLQSDLDAMTAIFVRLNIDIGPVDPDFGAASPAAVS